MSPIFSLRRSRNQAVRLTINLLNYLFICLFSYFFTYLFMKDHFDVCKKYPMVCRQRCGEQKVPRDKVDLQTFSSLTTIFLTKMPFFNR